VTGFGADGASGSGDASEPYPEGQAAAVQIPQNKMMLLEKPFVKILP
jgi:hypothetical protein